MDTALCTINKKSYDPTTFSQLDSHTLNSLQYALICQACHGKGYYRKPSTDTKPACFGAFYEYGCKYKSKNTTPRHNLKMLESVNVIITDNETLDVNFKNYTRSQLQPRTGSHSATDKLSSNISRQHTIKPVQTRHASKGLRTLLRMLRDTDTFAPSDIEINTLLKPKTY